MSDQQNIRELSQQVASEIGRALQQNYCQVNGKWHLMTFGRIVRELTQDEVDWHIARNHSPFVIGGITQGHPDWWKDPS